MKDALVIARREVIERKFVFLAALVLAILPVVVAFTSARAASRTDAMAMGSGFVTVTYTIGLALALGATIIGRELSEKRLSFYFSKPVSAQSIWFGKLAAAIFTVLVCGAVTMLPMIITGRQAWSRLWERDLGAFALGMLAVCTLLILLTHALSTMIRSRSALIGIDLGLFMAAVIALWWLLRPMIERHAEQVVRYSITFILIAVGVVLAGAGAWQLAHGRTDRIANHRHLSRFLWSGVAIILGVVAGYGAFLASAKPSDLIDPQVDQVPSGPWVALAGRAKGRADFVSSFLFNVDDGSYIRTSYDVFYDGQFSRDGKVQMAFTRIMPSQGRFTVVFRRLDPPGGKTLESNIVVGSQAAAVLSDDGSRVAVIDEGNVAVYDVWNEKSLGSARLTDSRRYDARMFFASPDLVKIYLVSATTGKEDRLAEFYDYDLRARQLRKGPALSFRAGRNVSFPLRVNHDGSIVVLRSFNDRDEPVRHVIDPKTGRTMSEVEGGSNFFGIRPLSDGTIAVARPGRLSIVSAEGVEIAKIAIPADRFSIGGEISPEKLIVRVRQGDRSTPFGGWMSYVVDTKRGVIERQEPIHTPFDFGWRSVVADPARVLYFDKSGAVGRWDTTTGEKRIVLKPAQVLR